MTLVSVCPRRVIILRTRPQDESNPAVTAVTMNTRWDGEQMETLLPYTKAAAVSKDGTIIGYRQLGKGPGVILIHGGMEASQHFMQLATLLADSFTLSAAEGPALQGRG